ncbi:anti-sigma-D factor RsdA [Pseudonocardia sp. CA-107938]|uniref:anti-sigma-D factor RsdA n=1 Tax=Pseudonocardia sp. CA-107938 TaxID=3240021 RepID=UPI003D90538A
MRDDEHPRHRGRPLNGHHRPAGMTARPAHLHPVEEPIDLVAVQADDELISALAAGMTVSAPGFGGYDADDHVAAILASWREDVDADPIPELVDIDTAIATIRSAGRPRTRTRHLAPVAAAAAFAVFAIGGVSVGSASAEPGDTLWGISKVLFSERADSIEAAARVEDRIDNAKRALASGQSLLAAQELKQAEADLAVVRPEEGKAELAEVQDFLAAKADETPPGEPTDPGQPLKKDKQRRVPQGAAVGEDPSTTPKPSGTTPGGSSAAPQPAPGTDPKPGHDPRSLQDPSTAPSGHPSASTSPTPSPTPSPTATPEGGPSSGTSSPPQSMGSTPTEQDSPRTS